MRSQHFGIHQVGQGEGVVSAVDVQIPQAKKQTLQQVDVKKSDFEEFTPGDIALIQRGSCTFTKKLQLAEQFGAVLLSLFLMRDRLVEEV